MREDVEVPHTPRVEIHYCPRCRWLMRAAWMAQELLMTFTDELGEVALIPSPEAGLFRVNLDGEQIFDRREHGGFPEVKELKQLIRDRVAPGRDLGHADRQDAS
jgi:selenoprotein W-related protein